MKPTTNKITDGYDRRGYIKPVKGVHDGLEFKYRLMLPEQVEMLNEAIRNKSGKDSVALVAAAIAKQINEWSEVEPNTPKGQVPKPLPISVQNIRSLPRPLLLDLRDVVEGSRPTDEPPEPTDKETDEYIAGLQADAEGKAAGQSALTSDIKN